MNNIRTIYWEDNAVVMIDQKALPLEERYVACRRCEEVIAAIKDMTIRGAPAIGVAAAMGIALGVLRLDAKDEAGFRNGFQRICDEFAQARPTARNLFWAVERMKKCFNAALAEQSAGIASAEAYASIKKTLVDEAILIGKQDVEINRRIGLNGRVLIKDDARILTHCNAGALATAGYGTALGVIRAAREEGKSLHVYVDETRPVFQGARLTTWEMKKEGVPATLITDSTAGFLMQQGKIDLIIVGADRIAANGDTANKIGTYTLAVLAKEHGIPFYIAAPLSTFDLSIRAGTEIVIEERDAREVSESAGRRIAPEGIDIYNPAFDITPNRYITAIITESGIILPPYSGNIDSVSRP